MKSFNIVLIVPLFVFVFINQAEATPKTRYDASTQTCRILNYGPLEKASQPWGEGGKLFKSACKSCHSRNNDQGAPFLWVESRTSEGWNLIFTHRSPKCAKNGVWDGLNLEQQMKINDYLYRWAANSQNPMDSC